MRNKIIIKNHVDYGDFPLLNVDLSKITVNRERKDRIYDLRISISGELIIFGNDYDKIITHNLPNIDIEYYENGVKLCDGSIDLKAKRDVYNRKLFKAIKMVELKIRIILEIII